MNILLLEDNETIIKGLKYAFKMHNYNLITKRTIKEALDYLEKQKVDLIILDIMLPDGNALEVYDKNIKNLNIPAIFLSVKDEEDIIVKALNIGAEDYLTKPFSTKELIARISKILNRQENQNLIKVQDITFDLDKMLVFKNKQVINLTALETKICHLLFINLNKVVTRNTILDKIWEWTGNYVDDHTITVYLKRIRTKLATNIIITIKGIGYRIDDEK